MSAHIALARTEGPKAGFNAYMATRVHTAAKRQAEIRSAGNKKQQFQAYCAIFGDQFGPVTGTGAVRSEAQRESVTEKLARLLSRDTVGVEVEAPSAPAVDPLVAALAEKLGVSVEKLAELVSDEPVETPTPAPAERTIEATRISWPMCGTLIRAAKKAGVEFEIVNKKGGKGTGKAASYAVKFDGSLLTPAQASEIIGTFKATR